MSLNLAHFRTHGFVPSEECRARHYEDEARYLRTFAAPKHAGFASTQRMHDKADFCERVARMHEWTPDRLRELADAA